MHLGPNARAVLDYAIQSNQTSVGTFLIGEGVDLNSTRGSTSDTPLMVAVSTSSVLMLKLLLAHGADPTRDNIFGSTPLIHAAAEGHLQAVGVLLAHGVPIDEKARLVLGMAARLGHYNVCELLLAVGTDREGLIIAPPAIGELFTHPIPTDRVLQWTAYVDSFK